MFLYELCLYSLLCVSRWPSIVLGNSVTSMTGCHQACRVVETTADPTATTIDQEYIDYVMRATQLAAWKLNSWHEYWRKTTHKWELDPDFTTDLNMWVNDRVKKNQTEPIVDVAFVDDMKDDFHAYCRCWKSKKFPLCDGAHNKHNKRTGDNVGPLFFKERHLLNDSLEFYNFMKKLKRK